MKRNISFYELADKGCPGAMYYIIMGKMRESMA